MAPFKKSGITGDKELIANLRELAKGPTKAEVDQAATQSLKPMLDKTIQRLKENRNFFGKYPGFPQPKSPRKGGHVDEGIVVKKSSGSSKTKFIYKLGATKRARYLLHLVEFGTAPHHQPNFRGGFDHPGARAHPSLLPSFDEEANKVPTTFGRSIWNTMTDKIARMKKGPRGK
ncbi:hypothetical protein GR212_15345 [Rhizobium lusitanum]|uniref:HK97 gp10 family phage protein n=1 Tax=Rhizobium lusitanum TaxID=293958 RepID=A0A6L9U8W3_9HYPH|nr:HK97 gp10 family phage protein [Rhizobium lusitanum]NEI70958.1 hypothetical protein [Rhizobium lusitanum]